MNRATFYSARNGPRVFLMGTPRSSPLSSGDILARLQAIASYPPQASRTTSQRQQLSQAIYDIEYRLMSIRQRDSGPRGSSGAGFNLSKPLHLATQLYALVVLRQVPRRSSLVQKYAQALSAELKSLQLLRDDCVLGLGSIQKSFLLFMEVLLLLSSPDGNICQDNIVLLVVLVQSLKLTEMQILTHHLKQVAWMDEILEDELADLWNRFRSPPR